MSEKTLDKHKRYKSKYGKNATLIYSDTYSLI